MHRPPIDQMRTKTNVTPTAPVRTSADLALPDLILAIICANLTAIGVCFLLYLNYRLFEPYFSCLLWAVLVSQALHLPKRAIVKQVSEWRCQGVQRSLSARHLRDTICSLYGASFIAGVAVMYIAAPWLLVFGGASCLFGGTLFVACALSTRLLSPDTLVTITLLLTAVLTAVFLLIFCCTQCLQEGITVATHVSVWASTALSDESVQRMYDTRRDDFLWKTHVDQVIAHAQGFIGDDGHLSISEVLQFLGMNATQWGPLVCELERLLTMTTTVATSNTTALGGFSGDVHDSDSTWFTKIKALSVGDFSFGSASRVYIALKRSVGSFDSRTAVEYISSLVSFLFGTSGFVVGGLLGSIFSLLFHSVNFSVNVGIFFTVVFYLLQSKHDCLHYLLRPLGPDIRPALVETLRRIVSDVLVLPIKAAFVHGLFTVIVFWLFDLKFRAFAALVGALFAAVPYLSAWLVCLPWVLALLLQTCYIRAAAFAVCYYLSVSTACSLIHDDLTIVHPYITNLSIFMGVTSFGVEGALFGPLLVCIGMAVYNVWRTYPLEQSRNDGVPTRSQSLPAAHGRHRFSFSRPFIRSELAADAWVRQRSSCDVDDPEQPRCS
eukprot:TRINITY_DN63486_c0_g1_i1.p1 TRINITY_DN63486_c0_g1~~TRINITY_DN63486_c0_g1_i1.p1  ORF type:complete len:607 (-),score=60.41 TRINITY_DN63486_c0_g1_i1:431-2251(-)